ncbi:MAG: hypothetical protein Q7S21_03355 [archaeon]|nr:hypothetical protein [archaeon]
MNKKTIGILLTIIGLLEIVWAVNGSISLISGRGWQIQWNYMAYAIPGIILLIVGLWLYFKK